MTNISCISKKLAILSTFRFVEKSNFMLEERNEGYKMTANQAQVRILALEQEKVTLYFVPMQQQKNFLR